ncbi:MAG: hypothetical protein ACN6OP_07860 [Pseudomonadales bacterium]
MSHAPTPLWNLATDFVLEKMKNGDLDRYGNVPDPGCLACWDYTSNSLRPTEKEMREYVERSKGGTLPAPMDWQAGVMVYPFVGVGQIIGH